MVTTIGATIETLQQPPPKATAENAVPDAMPSSREVGTWLECNGFKRAIAGDEDFNAAAATVLRLRTDRNKGLGLCVAGGCGCGKTHFVRTILRRTRTPYAFISLADPNQAERLNIELYPNENREMMGKNVILDDVGAELAVSDYGIRHELVTEFINRYHLNGEGRLIITTNLSGNDLNARYGERTTSRIKDLCLFLVMQGKDKRGAH